MLFEGNTPPEFRAGAMAAATAIKKIDHVLLAAHVNLDGDALGSLAAAGWILKQLGKTFALYSASGIPHYLQFLPLPGTPCSTIAALPFTPKAAIYLDCSDTLRLGKEIATLVPELPSINIDHHLGGSGLGTLANYIMPQAAATSQLMAYIALALGQEITSNLACAIALGLMTDTGGFCHGNTTAAVFSLCALLASNGCPMTELREELMNSWSLYRLRLWGELFERLKIKDNGQIALCIVTLADLHRHHCSVEDLEGLVDIFRRIRGVKVSAILREEPAGGCKFSLRSQGRIDVREMADVFGGGGHKNAAGGSIPANLREAAPLLLEAISARLALA